MVDRIDEKSGGSAERAYGLVGWIGSFKSYRRRVYAIPQPRGLGAVIEHMAQMGITLTAHNLGSDHEMAGISLLADGRRRDRLPITGPTTTSVKLGATIEQGLTTADAAIGAAGKMIPVASRKGWFGRLFSGDRVFDVREFATIVGVGFLHDEQLTARCCAQSGGGAAYRAASGCSS